MKDPDKTKQQLIEELTQLRKLVRQQQVQLARSEQAEADQRQIRSRLPVLVATAGLDGYYTEVNGAFEQILGWSEQESLSRPFMDFIHPDDRAAAIETFERLKSGNTVVDFVDRNLCRDGSYRWINWVVIPVPDRDIVFGIGQDITYRKQAERQVQEAHEQLEQRVVERTAALQESNKQLAIFKAFAEAAGQGFGMADMNGKIVYGNAALIRLVGESKLEHAYGKSPSTYYADDYLRLRDTEIFPILEKDGVWQGELTMVSVTGERIPVLQSSFTLTDQDGEPVRRGVVITDLRNVKQAERSLQDSLVEIQSIHDGMIDGFNILDMDRLKSVRANAALCEMTGYTEEELKASPIEMLHPPEDLQWILERAELHAAGRVSRSENIPILRRDGRVRYTDVSSSPINYKGRRCIMSFFHDITERKEAEEELRRSESKYKALVESSPDAVVMCDLDGQITFASPQVAERHGVDDPSELTGRSATSLVVEQERELMQSNIRHLLENGIRRNDQYTGLRSDGTTFYGEVSASVIRDASGQPEALMAVYRDITERKQAQAALVKAQDALRRMLQASDHDRELITYEIHDGVTQRLLGALMQFEACQGAIRRGTPEVEAMFDAGLKALREASAEARSLMNRTRTPVLQKFGVAAAIADFIDQFGERPNAPEITYRCETRFKRLQPTLENTIFRVAQEAITNACIHGKSDMVRVTLVQNDEEVTVEVCDDGIGFDTAELAEGRFGLDGIRERTRLLGKNLEIESAPGQGTRVRATFPLIYRDE